MRQIVAWTAITKAQIVHGPMHGVDADHDPALPLEERLQVANAPNRHRQAVRLRPLVQRRFQERPIGRTQGMRAASTWAVHQASAAFNGKALLPDVDPIGRGMEQARRARLGMAFLDLQQRLRPTADAWVRIRLCEVIQADASLLLLIVHWLRHGSPSQSSCLSSVISLLAPSKLMPICLGIGGILGLLFAPIFPAEALGP